MYLALGRYLRAPNQRDLERWMHTRAWAVQWKSTGAEHPDRVALLGDGRIVAEGTPREVLAGSLAFTTAVNKLYGATFLTPQDVLGNMRSA